MSEIAGRVLMIPKGTYSPTTTYDPLDAVNYEHNSYVCKQTSRGNLPTNTTYWQPLTDVTADEIPTEGSTNLVQSGGVYSANQTLKNKVTDISEVMGKNGAKNKEPFDIDVVKALNTTGTWTDNSYALNGITFAFADDGKVTVSGTASALCSINISGNYDLNGDYIITGCPSGGGSSTYSLRIYDSSATVVADDIGEGISFTANNLANCRTNIIVRKDAAFSTPIVFAPMIRDSKDPDATYQPYAMTNKELTENKPTGFVQLGTSSNTMNIFDIATDSTKYPDNTIYWGSTDSITNGSSTLKDLLSTGSGLVEIHKISEWYVSITIHGGAGGTTFFATENKNSTSITFVCIYPGTANPVRTVNVNKAT